MFCFIAQSRKVWNEVVCQTEKVVSHHYLVRQGLGSLFAAVCEGDSSAWNSESGFSREVSLWGASQPGSYAGGSLPEPERARFGTTPASSCLSALTEEPIFLKESDKLWPFSPVVETSAVLEGKELLDVGR